MCPFWGLQQLEQPIWKLNSIEIFEFVHFQKWSVGMTERNKRKEKKTSTDWIEAENISQMYCVKDWEMHIKHKITANMTTAYIIVHVRSDNWQTNAPLLFKWINHLWKAWEVTYPETKSEILQTSRLEIPYATELETMRSDCLQTHSADLSAGTTKRHHQRIKERNQREINLHRAYESKDIICCTRPTCLSLPRRSRNVALSLHRHLHRRLLGVKSKFPGLSGSGVGRVVSGSPLSPPQRSLLLCSSAAQNAREEEEEEEEGE